VRRRQRAGEIVALSLSGGKDSAAVALYLRELQIPHVRLFFDTGWEHPDLYAHLDYLATEFGPIQRLSMPAPDFAGEIEARVQEIESLVGVPRSAFVRLCARKGMFPSRMTRFCTEELKIWPFLAWAEGVDADVINAVGVRAEESAARASMPEWEHMRDRRGKEIGEIEVWRPILRWSEEEVIAVHRRYGLRPCPLYLRGAARVGCWPCIQAGKAELRMIGDDPRRVQAMRLLEALVGDLTRTRKERRGDDMTGWSPPALFQRSTPDAAGKYSCEPIDSVLDWARTERGGRQMSLTPRFGGGDRGGCMRWGMCDTSSGGRDG
jgi:3'-phosphoadenosine 5'-phosphosulfate sulfotransferase (PAPS reductase)/FAD synthetase